MPCNWSAAEDLRYDDGGSKEAEAGRTADQPTVTSAVAQGLCPVIQKDHGGDALKE